MKNLNSIDINNKSVLIRVDYNVPIKNNAIVNSFRIDSSIDTIRYCLDKKCKVVLMSHLGRPEGIDLQYSLRVVSDYLKTIFKNKVFFSSDCISDNAINLSKNLKEREIHILENLRFYKEEIDCDLKFSKKLSSHGEVFINDAFGTAHRAHASNVGVAQFFNLKSYGFLVAKELKYLHDSIKKNNGEVTLLIGGAKISDKIKLLSRFGKIAKNILIGGAMSNNFVLSEGMETGKSLIQKDYLDLAKKIMKKNKDKISIPLDFICTTNINNKEDIKVLDFNNIEPNQITADIGPRTIEMFNRIIEKSSCIVWNGPMGIIEQAEFSIGTKKMINSIKNATKKGCISIIGGGDTSSIIKDSEFDKFTHISTGGGASLKLLSGDIMPAFEALK